MKVKLLLVTLVLLQHFCSAQLQMAQLFCDHAVLQRDKKIPVWGTALPGEKVTIRFANQSVATTANTAGKWQATLLPVKAGGPYVLTASTNTQTITASDVLVGEVWICSGQSNMEFTVKQTDSFIQEKAQANLPSIRQFYVAHDVSFTPQSQIQPTSWSTCSPQTVENFTAVGYYFAKKLQQQLHIPIGLIHSSWGGSQVESWISKESFLNSETFKEVANNLPANWQQADEQLERKIKQAIFGAADVSISKEDEKKYVQKGYDFNKWLTGSYVLMQWDWQGIWAWRGNGYMAKKITIPANMVAAITTLGLAESYAYNEVYINGSLISSGIQKDARKIIVPANTWKAGDNWLVIKMNKLIEPSWYGVGFRGTAADFFVSDEQQTIPISVNNWKMMPAFAEEHSFAHSSNNAATTIYNSMIAPLVPYAIKGFLWYQGETNAGRAFQYRTAFPLLINDWRTKWGEELDFYFVQLANYGSYQNSNVGSSWAELREAQTMALQLPKTGMAVTIDIGNAADIHPTNKRDVGYRLAANAFKFTYNQPIVYTGPTYSTVQFKQQQAIVSFKNVGSGLVVKDKYGYIKGFEIAGADGVFHYAAASIKGNTVVVQSAQVTTPIAVRYAWADSPDDVNLFNAEGFPACPFRTDNWKCITASEKFK